MGKRAMDLVKISVNIRHGVIDVVDELVKECGMTRTEVINDLLGEAGPTKLREIHSMRVARIKIAERKLTDAERAQEFETQQVEIKAKKLQTQQLENRFNPHVLG